MLLPFILALSKTINLLLLMIFPDTSTSRFSVNISPLFVNTVPLDTILSDIFKAPVFTTSFAVSVPPAFTVLLFSKFPVTVRFPFVFMVP